MSLTNEFHFSNRKRIISDPLRFEILSDTIEFDGILCDIRLDPLESGSNRILVL
jgi:hypothetical protein